MSEQLGCDGCGREVTLMGNGRCGFCQQEPTVEVEIKQLGGEPQIVELSPGEDHKFAAGTWYVDVTALDPTADSPQSGSGSS